ncbi:hypothetical protein FOA52_002882 [Chlamydomonas sp. UWO 241]|nr:hypothetical protein FOA52_002882 [Chlamydomonas sp. UWO 241]
MEIAEERRVVCKVCLKQFSRYTCPRCNVAYCSLPCFKQHGESCTESFYRDQVDGEMRGLLTNDADKRAVLSILKRFHEDTTADAAAGPMTAAFGGGGGGESDDEGGADGNGEDGGDGDDEDDDGGDALFGLLSDESLERLLAKVAAAAEMAEPGDIDALMAQLSVDESDVTPSELRALAAAAARGALSSTLLPWQPWWAGEAAVGLRLSANGTPLVTEVPSTSSASGAGGSSSDSRGGGGGGAEGGGGDAAAAAGAPRPPPSPLPCMPTEPLPPLASLSSVPPSAALRWHVLDVLLSYCLIMRLYNGDVSGGCEADAASSMFAASAALLAASGQPQPRQGKPQQQQQQGAGKRLGGGAPAPGSVQQQQQREQQREQREQQQPPAPELPVTASSACLGFLSRACRPPVGDATQVRVCVRVCVRVSGFSLPIRFR